MPLLLLEEGKEVSIKSFGTTSQKTLKHLTDLGMSVGSKISVVCKNKGNVIVNVKNVRIALSSQLASKVMV